MSNNGFSTGMAGNYPVAQTISKSPAVSKQLTVSKKRQVKKDPLRNDPTIKEAENRIAAINAELMKLNEKIVKRARSLLQRHAIELISNQKWLIHGVDLYRKDELRFQLSLSAVYRGDDVQAYPSNAKPILLPATISKTLKKKAKMVFKEKADQDCDDLEILSSKMDQYNIGHFVIDDAYLSVNYDTLTISAQGEGCQGAVFALVKKLKLKIDYVSYLKTTEYAESEIAARKKLIDDLSSTVLFEI